MSRKTRRRQRAASKPTAESSEAAKNVPIQAPVPLEAATRTIGHRGLPSNRSYNGRRFARLPREHLTFSRMIRLIPIVGRAMTDFQDKCSRARWSAIPTDPDSERAVELAEFVEEELFRNPNFNWNDVVRREASHKFWGYSLSEWTAGFKEDGTITFVDLAPRSQATISEFITDLETDKVIGFQQGYGRSNFIPAWKTVYLSDVSVNDEPEGQGVLARARYVAEEWFDLFKTRSISIKQDIRGMFVARVPQEEYETLSDEQKALHDSEVDDIISLLNNQTKGENMGIVLPSELHSVDGNAGERIVNVPKWGIELLQGESKGLAELEQTIENINRDMARALYAEHILLGDNSVGSYALADIKAQSVYQLVDEALITMARGYENCLVRALFELNGLPMELMPRLEAESPDYRTLQEDIQAVQMLNTLPPESPSIDHFAAKLGIPVLPMEERIRLRDEERALEQEMMNARRSNADD